MNSESRALTVVDNVVSNMDQKVRLNSVLTCIYHVNANEYRQNPTDPKFFTFENLTVNGGNIESLDYSLFAKFNFLNTTQ